MTGQVPISVIAHSISERLHSQMRRCEQRTLVVHDFAVHIAWRYSLDELEIILDELETDNGTNA